MKTTAPHERPTPQDNMGLVHFMAKRYRWACGVSLEYEDLVQAGTLGLITACSRFEPERGIRFSAFALPWVRHHIGRLVSNQNRTVRIPTWAQEKLRRERVTLPSTLSL